MRQSGKYGTGEGWPHKMPGTGGKTAIDDKVFEIFFRDNFLRFCIYCQYKFGFDTQLAKEAVHTAFIKLWESRDKVHDISAMLPYLQRIVYNNCIDTLKHDQVRSRYKNSILSESSTPSIEAFSALDMKELQADIDLAVSTLPTQMQTVFRLSRFEGLRYSEIAAHLDISIKTVETQMSRALVKLKQKLARYLYCVTFSAALAAEIYFSSL